jgi:hypothetical protein
MATRLTVTMTTSIADGSTRRSECVQMAAMLERLAGVLGSTHSTSGTITDRNGLPTLTYDGGLSGAFDRCPHTKPPL